MARRINQIGTCILQFVSTLWKIGVNTRIAQYLLLLREIREVRPKLIALALLSVLSGFSNAALLGVITYVLSNQTTPVGRLVMIFGAVTVVMVLSRHVQQRCSAKVAGQVTSALRNALATRILRSPLAQLERRESAHFLTALTYDVNLLAELVSQLPGLMSNAALLIGAIVYLGYLAGIYLLALFLAFAGFGVLIYGRLNRSMQSVFKRERALYKRLMTHYADLMGGLKELKLDAQKRDRFIHEYLADTSAALQETTLEVVRKHSLGVTVGQLLIYCLIALIVFVYPLLANVSSEVKLGFTIVILFAASPLDVLIASFPMFANARVSLTRLAELGDELERLSEDLVTSGAPPAQFSRLSMHRVRFSHGDRVDQNEIGPIEFALCRGEIVFVVGGNGSGKTTLIKLLCGLYQPNAGEIVVNGVALTDWIEYRRQFAVVFSDFHILDSAVGIYDWGEIFSSPQAQHFDLPQVRPADPLWTASALSKGQRRRLALWIAATQCRQIHIFDEPGADLDPEFKRFLYLELVPWLRSQGKTLIVVTHDSEYFHVADRVIAMRDGKIIDEHPGKTYLRSTSSAKQLIHPVQ